MDMPHKCYCDDEVSAGTIYRRLAAPLKSRAGTGGLENRSAQSQPVEGTAREMLWRGQMETLGAGESSLHIVTSQHVGISGHLPHC